MNPIPSDITGGNLTDTKQSKPTKPPTLFDILSYAKKVAPRIGKKLRISAEDLVQDFALKLVEREYALEEVRFYRSWTYQALYRTGQNQLRHYELEWNSTEPLEWEDGQTKENYACRQQGIAYSSNTDPLNVLLRKEDKAELKKRVQATIDNIVASLPPRERSVVCSTLKGIPPEDIAKEIRRATKTVYKLRKASKPTFKRIVKELKLEAHLKTDPDLVGALVDLVASSLRENGASVYVGV
jgi:RNA polymerase sigma factor (sigma-70 family)